jgi:putative signal transducing protein
VEVSREELAKRFESLSDEEVLQLLRSGTLTSLAVEVAADILDARGVDPLSVPGAPDSTRESIDGEGLDLVTVAVEWDPLKANLLRALLESQGIFAYVWGEHLATMHIFLSNAGGGSRVQVRSDQLSQARELLSAFQRGELEAPDLPDQDAVMEQTTPSHPYTFPSNPYTPSPAAINTRVADRSSMPPPDDRSRTVNPERLAIPRTAKRVRPPVSPARKIALAAVSSVVVLTLWLLFTH